ncbi:uncharacterized protein SAPINGB_P003720 [Magnusiomyces paraingens]|uniref:Major facilitator superfamily (MFS) profile domain-containing protein n=1 Tax=Magnusiomyces paraingens TaxID=2606893 RepID=A0A5E8BT32_9ASCO|nr:uncharacterized protein SAPINGB_P003720 [Saprochaete ingens]VVT53729.1 unnamed protein product [Saprochaete ingens]
MEQKTSIENSSQGGNPEEIVRDTGHPDGFHNGTKTVGIKKIEAMSKQYGRYGKILFFFSMFLIAYTYGLDQTIRYVFLAQAQSSYGHHSLLSTVNVAASIIAVAAQPFYARLSDVFGRTEILFISVIFYVIGTIIESQADNVQTFAGGAIIYQFGITGIMLLLQLLAADFSFLNWRLLSSFVPAIPFIINTWVSGNVSAAFGTRWSWGIACWAIILPVISIPLFFCLFHMRYLAKKNGDFDEINEDETEYRKRGFFGFVKYLFFKIDAIGLFLIIAVFALILVPLTLAGGVSTEWKHAKIIAPLIIGGLLIPVFVTWEMYSPEPVIPFFLIKDRGVWAAFCIAVLINFIWYMQGDYMYTVLVVSVNQSVKSATRITQLYSFTSVVTGTILGFVVAKVRYLKPFIVFGACIWIIAMGLMIHYRGGMEARSGIIGSLVLLGFGAGFFTYPTQNSIQSVTNHEYLSIVTSLYLASYYIGSALGNCVSGAIWTQTLAKEIEKELTKIGAYSLDLITLAYGSPFTFIVEYPWGSPERMAVVVAYKTVQRYLLITGTCLCVPLIAFTLCLRNHKLVSAQNRFDDQGTPELNVEDQEKYPEGKNISPNVEEFSPKKNILKRFWA